MIVLKPGATRHTTIVQSEVGDLLARFFQCFDKTVILNLLRRHAQSNRKGHAIDIMNHSKRLVAGVLSVCLIHSGIRPPDDFPLRWEAIFLIKFCVELYEQGTEAERNRLWGMLRNALAKDSDARQLFFELAIAFVYTDFGATVHLTDLGDQTRFEFQVEKDGYQVEVEVKAISSSSGHSLPASVLDAFAAGAHALLEGMKFPYSESHISILINGKHKAHGSLLEDLTACAKDLKRGQLKTRHGNIDLSVLVASPGDFAAIDLREGNTSNRLPERLERFPLLGLLNTRSGRAFITVAFTAPWNISSNLDTNLGDAFRKFSGKNPAVVWVCLTDATPFAANPDARDIGFFRNHKIQRVFEKYRSPGRYEFPTGIVVASTFAVSELQDDCSELSLLGRYRYFPSKGAATEHFKFAPYHERPF